MTVMEGYCLHFLLGLNGYGTQFEPLRYPNGRGCDGIKVHGGRWHDSHHLRIPLKAEDTVVDHVLGT